MYTGRATRDPRSQCADLSGACGGYSALFMRACASGGARQIARDRRTRQRPMRQRPMRQGPWDCGPCDNAHATAVHATGHAQAKPVPRPASRRARECAPAHPRPSDASLTTGEGERRAKTKTRMTARRTRVTRTGPQRRWTQLRWTRRRRTRRTRRRWARRWRTRCGGGRDDERGGGGGHSKLSLRRKARAYMSAAASRGRAIARQARVGRHRKRARRGRECIALWTAGM